MALVCGDRISCEGRRLTEGLAEHEPHQQETLQPGKVDNIWKSLYITQNSTKPIYLDYFGRMALNGTSFILFISITLGEWCSMVPVLLLYNISRALEHVKL